MTTTTTTKSTSIHNYLKDGFFVLVLKMNKLHIDDSWTNYSFKLFCNFSKIINGNDDTAASNNIGDDNEQQNSNNRRKNFQFLYHTQGWQLLFPMNNNGSCKKNSDDPKSL